MKNTSALADVVRHRTTKIIIVNCISTPKAINGIHVGFKTGRQSGVTDCNVEEQGHVVFTAGKLAVKGGAFDSQERLNPLDDRLSLLSFLIVEHGFAPA